MSSAPRPKINRPLPDGPKFGLGLTLLQQVDSFPFMRWTEILRSGYSPGPVLNGRRAYVSMARNIVIDDFFQRDRFPLPVDDWEPGELDALFFWDSDQLPWIAIPERDGSLTLFTRYLQNLLMENPEKEVIVILYFSRETQFAMHPSGSLSEFPHEPVAYERVPDGRYGHAYKRLTFERMTNEILTLDGRYKLHKVGGGGTGAMLIRKSLLERLSIAKAGKPIFENPDTPDGRTWTEDLYFCEQVQSLDPPAEIWLSACEVAHQGDRIWLQSQHYLAAHGQVGLTREAAEQIERAKRDYEAAVSAGPGSLVPHQQPQRLIRAPERVGKPRKFD